MRALEDFDARSRHAREAIGRPETLSGEEWAALAQETVDLLPDWNELQFDLNLARLYPGPANNTVRLFALGDANETEKVYRDALYQGSLSDPIRISVAGNEWASFQLQVLPFWRRLTEAQVSFSDLKGPGGHILPADRYLWFRMKHIKVTNDDPYTRGLFITAGSAHARGAFHGRPDKSRLFGWTTSSRLDSAGVYKGGHVKPTARA